MLTNKEMAQVLYEASNLLEEKGWCQGMLGRTAADKFITDRDDGALYSDGASHLCMEGAIFATMGKFAVPEALEVMGTYYRRNKGVMMCEFNDCARNKTEVLTEMRQFALSLLEEQMEVAA